MQYTVLLTVLLIVSAIVVLLNFRNSLSMTRHAQSREDVNIDEVFQEHFSDFDKAGFHEVWDELSLVIGVPANKLSPTDTISDFAGTRHLPEPYLEKLEIYFVEKGLNPSEVNVGSPLKDVVRQILQRHKSH